MMFSILTAVGQSCSSLSIGAGTDDLLSKRKGTNVQTVVGL